MSAPEREREAEPDEEEDAAPLDEAHARIDALVTAIAEREQRIEAARGRLAMPADASTPMAQHRARLRELERALTEARAARDALPQPTSAAARLAPYFAMVILFLAWLVMVYRP